MTIYPPYAPYCLKFLRPPCLIQIDSKNTKQQTLFLSQFRSKLFKEHTQIFSNLQHSELGIYRSAHTKSLSLFLAHLSSPTLISVSRFLSQKGRKQDPQIFVASSDSLHAAGHCSPGGNGAAVTVPGRRCCRRREELLLAASTPSLSAIAVCSRHGSARCSNIPETTPRSPETNPNHPTKIYFRFHEMHKNGIGMRWKKCIPAVGERFWLAKIVLSTLLELDPMVIDLRD
ncbi:uncharacterized protein LOC121804013 [Salvia splendens]|uniref:uncharacterized protein LOC121804013 n=1 Tax=Salvia splendens TaxID=180675 RepID=UPI001C27A4E7|nr:uncharacterized protein LOC121804013 [Salvia splendens]